jgi:3-oxoacyl-[acyl-carrier protein] reductase
MWLTYKMDVTQAAEIAEMVDDLNKRRGRLDVLVNNAGITQRAKVSDMSEAVWDQVIAVNLRGTFLLTRALLAGMQNIDQKPKYLIRTIG